MSNAETRPLIDSIDDDENTRNHLSLLLTKQGYTMEAPPTALTRCCR
ncbi:MAG: hypothetical protein PHV74_12540 [Dehalococcoidia bacterium]|nr:hypothetical protein [Dehalococcoidia bacterium]